MHVHAGSVVVQDRLGHKGSGLAVQVGGVVHHVLVNLHPVGAGQQGRADHTQFVLGRRHFVVVFFHGQSHGGHGGDHFRADVTGAVHRRHREIPALNRRPVAGVAVLKFAAGVIGAFFLVNRIKGVVHGNVEAHVVEYEKFRLRPEHGRVADAGEPHMSLGALGQRARVPGIGLAGSGLVDVAKQDQRRLGRIWVHHGGRRIGHQGHVGFVDHLPPGNGRAIEHNAVRKRVLVHHRGIDGQVLPLSPGVGETKIDEWNFFVLDALQDGCCVGHVRRLPLLIFSVRTAVTRLPSRVRPCGSGSRHQWC